MANLASTQLEQLREIGAYLRQVRQQQGLALDDIASQIFIRPTLLRAVEEGQDQHLPEPVFVQGFIRRYGDALGLDGSDLAQNFTVNPMGVLPDVSAPKASQSNGRVEPELRQPVQPIAAEAPVSATPRRSGETQKSGGLPLGLIGALVVLAAGVGLGLWSLSNRNSQPSIAKAPQPTAPPVAATPTPVPIPTPTATAAPKPKPDAPVVADLKFSDRAWISVIADGKAVFEGILEKGAAKTWKAQNSLNITSGNAGGVTLSFNGAKPVTLGDPGTVKTVTLTPTTDPASLATP